MIRLLSIVIVLFALTATANAQCPGGKCYVEPPHAAWKPVAARQAIAARTPSQRRQPVRNTVKAVVHAQPVRRIVKPLKGIRERAKARREARRERRRNRRGR